MQHGLVVEARNHRHAGSGVEREAIELDGEGRAERAKRLEGALHVDGGGRAGYHHSQMPIPKAVGSRNQSGGVSQTNARIAITHRS